MNLSVSEIIFELTIMINEWCINNPKGTQEEIKLAVHGMTDLYFQAIQMRYNLPRHMVQ